MIDLSTHIGETLEKEMTITARDTAQYLGSGKLPVFATPAMVALMENCAMGLVSSYLSDGLDSVGTAITVKHCKATKVGEKVCCTAKLIAVNSRELTFEVAVFEGDKMIGSGTHTRFIIQVDRFLQRL